MAGHFISSRKKLACLSALNFQIDSKNKQFSPENKNIFIIQSKFDYSPTKIPVQREETASECLRCLWPFLLLSRILGICPVIKEGNNIIVKKLNLYWIFTIIGCSFQCIMLAYAFDLLYDVISNSKEGWAESINEIIYYSHTFGNTIFVLCKIHLFPQFFAECKKVELMCKKYKETRKDDGLIKHCTMVFAFFFITQFIGNACYYYSVAEKQNVTSVEEFFKGFNNEFVGDWGGYCTGIFFCLGDLYCDMGWTYGDIMLSLLSIILARYFTRLNKEVQIRGRSSVFEIEEMRMDHRTITDLVAHCNQLFSSLFLLSFMSNIVYLLSRLYTGLGKELTGSTVMSVKIEAIYAFLFQILIKILFPSYLATKLHTKAHETLQLIHAWPSCIESNDNLDNRLLVIARFVSQLVTDQIGISGMGYFTITKGFLVTLVSGLLTYEVVILQFQAAGLSIGK